MLLQGSGEYFNPDHVCRIRVTRERDKVSLEPIRYTVYLTGHSQGVDVAGDDIPAFHAWLSKNGITTAETKAVEVKPDQAKKAG